MVDQMVPFWGASLNCDLLTILESLKNAFRTVSSKTDANESKTVVEDLALFALDCAYTLHVLLEIYPASHGMCHRLEVLQTITNFYDSTLPKLHKNLHLIDVNSHAFKYLNSCRLELLSFFRAIVCKCLDIIIQQP